MIIDRQCAIPLYHQLKIHIIEMIKDNKLKYGEKLPTEGKMVTQFGLSRFPIRQALDELEREGWIIQLRGRGSFVSEPRTPLSVAWQLLGFSEDMKRKGHKVETRIIENQLIPAPSDIAIRLEIKPKTSVVFIRRLRFLDSSPYLVDFIHVRSDFCPGLEKIDLNNASLFATFENRYSIRVMRAKRTLRITAANSEVARMLELETETPLFLLTDLCYIKEDIPIQFAKTLIKEKKCEFVFDLLRQEDFVKTNMVRMEDSTYPKLKTNK